MRNLPGLTVFFLGSTGDLVRKMTENVVDSGLLDLEPLRGLTQCSVCRGRLVDPRVLPCLHSFCLDCIQRAGASRRPGNLMPCPLCRKKFTIPDEDFESLQKDFRLQGVLDALNSSLKFNESGAEHRTGELMRLETIFCYDCRAATSVRDHFDLHRSHNCSDVMTAIRLLQDRVVTDERKVLGWESEILHRSQQVESERTDFILELDHSKRVVKKRAEELRLLVETHIRALEKDLGEVENDVVGELVAEKDALEAHLLSVRRFVSRCGRFKSLKGTLLPGDACRLATELHAEAEKLERRKGKIGREWNSSRSLEVRLNMTKLEEFLAANNNNVVGKLQTIRHPRPRSNVSMRAAFAATWRMLGSLDTRVLVSGLVGLLAGLSVVVGFNAMAGVIVGLSVAVLLFVVLYPLLPKTNVLRLSMSFKRHERHSCGVTYLRHRVYILLQSPSSVVVFPNRSPFVQLEEIQLPQVAHPSDVASCHVTDSLYIADSGARCVWRLSVGNADRPVTCWLRDLEKPHTLSVSGDGRVTVVREGRPFSTVEVYDQDAVKVASVRLPALVTQPYHCVETSAGNFVVSHGTWISHTHGLVEVDRHGVVLSVYNSTECLWGILKAITLLLDPTMRQDDARHLAIDYNDTVFVADWFNDRIMQFDSGFRSHRIHVTSAASGLGWPILRLCYVKETRQMLIVHETSHENRVNVYRLH